MTLTYAVTDTPTDLVAALRLGVKPAAGVKVWVWATGPSRLVVTPTE